MLGKKFLQEKQIPVILVLLYCFIAVLIIIIAIVFLIRLGRDDDKEFYTINQDGNRIYTAEVYEKAKSLEYNDRQGIEELIEILSHDEIKDYISDYKKDGIPNLVCSILSLNTAGYPVQDYLKFEYDGSKTSLVGYSQMHVLYALSDEQVSSYDMSVCETEHGKAYDVCDYKRIGYDLLYNLSTTNGELIPTRYKDTSLQDLYAKFQGSSAGYDCEIND